MGLVKIDDTLHEEARRASTVMCRSINAQAEFWMKIGMLAEANPAMTFNDIVKTQLGAADVRAAKAAGAMMVETD
ncbi:MAG: ParD-like family protein [Oceanicaulis sp.]|nr:ParD-like family protein [Oceanicaulis sp.]